MKHILVLTALGLFFGCSAAYANHIDTFEDGAFSLTARTFLGNRETVRNIDPGSTLGGQRNVTLKVDGIGFGGNRGEASVGSSFNPGPGNDSLNYTSNAGGSLGVGTGFGLGNDLNANFLDIPGTAADWDRVRLDFGPGSSAALVNVFLYSRQDGGSLLSQMSFAGGDNNLDFLYSSFGPEATPEFLRNIDRASFTVFAPDEGGNYAIESFTRAGFVPENSVPAPGGLGLLALGLTLMGFTAFRRNIRG